MWYCFLHDFIIDFFHDIVHKYAITDIVMTDDIQNAFTLLKKAKNFF